MKPRRKNRLLIPALIAAAMIGGYELGRHPAGIGIAAAAERTPLYYQDPSGKPDYSPTPKKDAEGRDYVPVYDEPGAAPASTPRRPHPLRRRAASARSSTTAIPWACPTPRRCRRRIPWAWTTSRSMPTRAAAPFRARSRSAPSASRCSACAPRPHPCARMAHTVRAVGTVAADERRIGVVNPKFEGWIEKLLVNTTGQTVRRGEALLEVYSPDLVLAQREYLVARAAAADMAQADAMARDNAKAIAAAALSRLKNWDISADQLARLQRTGTATRTLTLSAPIGGIVMEKTALEGLHFGAGDMLYRIVDLSTVWLLADVFEQDLAQIRPGQSAENHRAGLSRPRLRRARSPSSTRP